MEYNKRQFQKSNDKKVLHKVKKHWVVLSTALLMMIGSKAAFSHINAHANVDSNNQINQQNTLKDQINQNLIKPNRITTDKESEYYNQHNLSTGQIEQQASELHNHILLNKNNSRPYSNDVPQLTKSVNGRQNNNQVKLSSNKINKSQTVNSNNKSYKVKAVPHTKESVNSSDIVNDSKDNNSNVNKPRLLLSSSMPMFNADNDIINGKWNSANYSLDRSTGLLTVNGGQINHFQYFKSAHPNDPLVQNEKFIRGIKFNNVQAPSDSSAYNMGHNGSDGFSGYDPYFNNLRDSNYNNLSVENGEFFPNQANLTNVDASGLNTSGTTTMMGMFGNMPHLSNVTLGGQFNVSNVTNMSDMFWGDRSLKNLDLHNFNASDVTTMASMFCSDPSLTNLNLDNFRTSSDLKNTSMMFSGDSSLKHINLKGFNTTQDRNMYSMFGGDGSLDNLDFNSNPLFDTSNVTNMSEMFFGDFDSQSSPVVLDVSHFNTGNVTNMNTMFEGANVKKIILGNNFDTSKVTDMGGMFANLFYIKSIGFSPMDNIYLGNHFDLKKCFDYGYWSYSGPKSATKSDLLNPDNWYSTSSARVGVFGNDPNLDHVDFSHMQPGIDANNLVANDSDVASVNLQHFHLTGPEILSSDGHTYTTTGGYTVEHPGIKTIPNIKPGQDNPYKNYDMLSTNVDYQSLVTVNLGPHITFKKDPSVDPNQAPGQVAGGENYLDGTFYRINSDGKLTSANLVDNKVHPGNWFRNKGVNVIAYVNHGKTVGFKTESKYDGEDESNFYDKIVHAPAPSGYTIPDPKDDIVISQTNKNDGPHSLPDMVGVVQVVGDPSIGTTEIPAKFYSDNGGFVKNGTVKVHYNGNIGTKFVATTNNVDNIPDENGSGGYHIIRLDPSNNEALIIPASATGNAKDYPSVLSWDDDNEPGREPTAIFRHMDPLPNYKHIETVPYEFVNQQGRPVSNISYITQNNVGHPARYGDTVDLPTTIPSNLSNGYEMDSSRDPKSIVINKTNTGDPANGQTNLVKLYIIGKLVNYSVPVTVKVSQKGFAQPKYAQAQITLKGRVGDEIRFNSSDITNNNLKYEMADGQEYNDQIIPHSDTTLVYDDTFTALLKPNDRLDPQNEYAWNKAGLWDNNNNRPEVDFAYDPKNVAVHFIDESNPSHHINNGSNISPYDNIMNELGHETIPNGYYVDPLHQDYSIKNIDGQRYININLLNDKIWTGYKWGNADVNIDTANDTVYVYGGGFINTNDYQDGNSIFDNLIKDTITHDPEDPQGNQTGVNLSQLPNHNNDWKVDIQNASVNPNINSNGLFEGNGSMSNQFTSVDAGHLNTNHASDLSNMFMSDQNLADVNLKGLDTSNTHNMMSMFQNDPKLINLNLSNLDTSKVNNMGNMFSGDSALKNLRVDGSFNTDNVSDMSDMFNNDSSLSDLNLTNFDTTHVNEMYGMFDSDNALNKLTLGSKTNLSQGDQDFGSNFFNHNVNSNGAISTLNLRNGHQASDMYYAAHPVAIKLVNQNQETFNTNDHIDEPNRSDDQYHGQIANQIDQADVQLPYGYSKAASQDYTIHNPSNNPYVNIRITGNRVTVPVIFMDTTPGFNSHPVTQFKETGTVGNLVSIPTNLPTGYQWNDNQPSNPYQYRIVDGNGEGQVFDNSGTTKPVVFNIETANLNLPVRFIDRTPGHNNQIVKSYSDDSTLDQSTLLDTTLPNGYHWDGAAPADPDDWLVQPGNHAGQMNSNGTVNPIIFNVLANRETIPVDFIDETPGHNEQIVKHYSDEGLLNNSINLDTTLPTGYQWDQIQPNSTWQIKLGNGMGQVNTDGQVNPIIFKIKSQSASFPVEFVDDSHNEKVIKHYSINGQMGSTAELDTSLPIGYQWNQHQPANPDMWTVSAGNGAGQMNSAGQIQPLVFHVAASPEIVPVEFKNGDQIVKRESISSRMDDPVSIDTTLPSGYQWNQNVPNNPDQFIIINGSKAGQVNNNSGYTNPIIFQVKTSSAQIPIKFIDRTPGHNNQVVNSFSIPGTTGDVITINTTLPQGYYWDQSIPMNPEVWTVTGGNGSGQINSNGQVSPIVFNVKAENETVPVEFIDNNDNLIKHFDVQGQTGGSVRIDTTVPTGYSWNQSPETNPLNWTIKSGNGAGQITNNSGYTNPLIFRIKGDSNTIPVKFVDQNNQNVGYSSVTGSVNQTVNWPNQAPSGYQINQGQEKSHTLTSSDVTNHKTHIIHVTGDKIHTKAHVTIVKMGNNGEQSSNRAIIPLEGHVGDKYTFNNSDFVNVPSDYTLSNNGQSYTADLVGTSRGFQWAPTTNTWDNQNDQPEIVLKANQAQPVTLHYINQANDQIGETTLNGLVNDSQDIGNPATDNNSYFAQNPNVIPNEYTYNVNRNHNSRVTFTQNPQNVDVYVIGKPTSAAVDYQYQGQDMGSAGMVHGQVGDSFTLPTNNVPTGFSIDPSQNLNLMTDNHNNSYDHLKLINPNQDLKLVSNQMTVPVEFVDGDHNDKLVATNNSVSGKIGDTVTLPSAPKGYQYKPNQSNQYTLKSNQIQSDHEMDPIIIKLSDDPAQVRIHYVDQLGHDLTDYTASGVINSHIRLNNAPEGYLYNNYNDNNYQFKSNNISLDKNGQPSLSNGRVDMKDYTVYVHSNYFDNIEKHVQIKYENANGSARPSDDYRQMVSFSGRIGDVYFFNPENLNVPKGYQLMTTNNDQAVINPDGTATWITDTEHRDPVVIFKAESSTNVPHEVNITQVKELPNGQIVGSNNVSEAINDKSVGQTYQISDNADGLIKAPANYHLAENSEPHANDNQTLSGEITPDGITKDHAVWYYVANNAPMITVHYRIHGHNSDVGTHTYQGAYYQNINGMDAIPKGYYLDTDNTKVNSGTTFTFGKDSQPIIYVKSLAPNDHSIKVTVILQNSNGQPVNNPQIPVITNAHGRLIRGYQILVPIKAGADDDFTITPNDSALKPYTNGFTQYHNSNIQGYQKDNGPEITSNNKGIFTYRTNFDVKDAGTITVQYRNQNGDLVANPSNHTTDYQIPNGYRDRYVSDVTKLAGIPRGYQLLGNNKLNYTFNGTHQNALIMLKGDTASRPLNIKIIKEDPNGQKSTYNSDSDDVANAAVGNTYTIMPSDYLPSGYREDTTKDRDQPAKFTVQSDGSFNNNGIATFYYLSNADNNVKHLQNIKVNYANTSNQAVDNEIINPSQVSDAYDGRVISDVTKYAQVPKAYTVVQPQDLQATMSDNNSPAITVRVNPTSSIDHDSDNQNNAQPVFVSFKNKNNSQIVGQANRRLDGYMNQIVDPFNRYSIPTGYNLVQTKPLPEYTISNHPQHYDILVAPKADSTRDYWLTVRILTPSDHLMSGINNPVQVPIVVPLNSSTTVDPSHIDLGHVDFSQLKPGSKLTQLLNSKYYSFDSADSSNSFRSPLTITNHSEVLSATNGTLTYKANANPEASLGTITVTYYNNDVPMYNAGGTINHGYLGKQFTAEQLANDITDKVQIPNGYHLDSGQNQIYTMGSDGNVNANLDVHGIHDDPTSPDYVANVKLVKIGANNQPQGQPTMFKLPITGNVGSDYVIKASDYAPHGYIADPNYPSQIRGTIRYKGLSTQNPVLYYVPNTNPAPIYVRYINQNGQQVGRIDVINGHYGDSINVSSANSYGKTKNDHGENVPDGYTLQGHQNTNYKFDSDSQYANLYVIGNSNVTDNYVVHIVENHGDNQPTTYNVPETITGRVGDQKFINPTDYLPGNDYGVNSSDQVQAITVTPNDISNDTKPNVVSFTYDENPVTAQLIYKDSTDGANVNDTPIGERTISGSEGSRINYDNYTEFLPNGYVLDHVDDPSRRLEKNQSYVVYLKRPSTKPAEPVNYSDAYINLEYKDTSNNHIVDTETLSGRDLDPFNLNIYTTVVPRGYQDGTLDPASATPGVFQSGTKPTVVIDVSKSNEFVPNTMTDTVSYVNFNTGYTIGQQSVTRPVGTSIDWSPYTKYVPGGYYYYKLGAHENRVFGNSNVIYVLPSVAKLQYSSVNINYIDASDGRTLTNDETYGMVGEPFDISHYEDDVTQGTGDNQVTYHYDHADDNNVSSYGLNSQTVNVYVKKPASANPFGLITVKYVDADHNDAPINSLTVSGIKGDIFDPSSFENNLPEGYSFKAIKGNAVYNFNGDNQDMIIQVTRDNY